MTDPRNATAGRAPGGSRNFGKAGTADYSNNWRIVYLICVAHWGLLDLPRALAGITRELLREARQ